MRTGNDMTRGALWSLLVWSVLLAAALGLSGCSTIYAGELARDALAKCAQATAIEYRGGRWHDSASTVINCRPVPAQEGRYATHP